MGVARTYPDGYTYEWLSDLAAKGEPIEPGYDGIVLVLPAQRMRVVIEGNEEDVIITSVTRLPLGWLSAEAIDSDGNHVALPAIDPTGKLRPSLGPTRTPVNDRAREVGKYLADRYLGTTRDRDSGDTG